MVLLRLLLHGYLPLYIPYAEVPMTSDGFIVVYEQRGWWSRQIATRTNQRCRRCER